jgi:Zn finger protein HypA/HybF involved in hydrogenase expression
MIINEKIKIKISNKTIGYYKTKYKNLKSGDIIEIYPKELPKGSNKKIKVKCFNCGIIKEVIYYDYNKITKNDTQKYYCNKCKAIPTKKTNQKLYGVDNVFQLESVKEQSKKTNKEKYGVEYALQNSDILEKQKNTNLERTGYKFQMQNPKNKKKSKETCKLLYDEEIGSKSKIIKDITIQNNLKKYGVNFPNKLDYVKNNIKETKRKNLLKKYKELGLKTIKSDGTYVFKCEKGHDFEITSVLLYNRLKYKTVLCTKCNKINSYNISGLELQLQEFIQDNYDGEIIFSNRSIIKPYELDIYLPELNLAFEFNGVYWHNELNKPENYHLNKTESCLKKGIQLIHIYEDDWIYKQEIIKSRLKNKFNKSNKIFARKTEIKEIIDNKLIREFLNKNHLQGFVGSSIKIGLFFNNELVSLMTFGKKRKIMGSKHEINKYELLRFCNKLYTNVVGGASKLFKYFIRNYKYDEILTYADRSWSKGELYEKLGFNFISKTVPNYYYVVNSIRQYRFNYRKNILVKEGFNPSLTEHEIMLERNIYRIYDSGNLKYNLIF